MVVQIGIQNCFAVQLKLTRAGSQHTLLPITYQSCSVIKLGALNFDLSHACYVTSSVKFFLFVFTLLCEMSAVNVIVFYFRYNPVTSSDKLFSFFLLRSITFRPNYVVKRSTLLMDLGCTIGNG